MNLEEYKKIDGRAALKRVMNGGTVRDRHGLKYCIDKEHGTLWTQSANHSGEDYISISMFLLEDWYIEKSFDVRKTLLSRPNEWVAAFKDEDGAWNKVGFDSSSVSTCSTDHWGRDVVKSEAPHVYGVSAEDLDQCIPIEDVPEGES